MSESMVNASFLLLLYTGFRLLISILAFTLQFAWSLAVTLFHFVNANMGHYHVFGDRRAVKRDRRHS